MSQRDKIIIQKILQYCKDVEAIIHRFGDDIRIYESDLAYQYACSMCIIQIGELVGQLSDELKNERPEISWKLIKDMRNLFAHDYVRVDNEIVWDTLKNNIPDLEEKCKSILGEDLALLPRVPLFEQALERIDERAEYLNMKTAYARATRGYWSGAGFGTTIKSTVSASTKASVAAGVMNIGSGVLHGIGDSIVDAMNNAEIRDMGKKVFENPVTINEFDDEVFGACLDIGTVVRRIIENHSNVKLEALEGIIKFGNENLADIDERSLNAKINNNLSVANNEYAYALLIEKLRRHPLNGDAFDQIIDLTIQRSHYGSQECKAALRYACDFRLEGQATVLYNSINSS